MKGLIEALKKIKEDRMLGSAAAETLERFIGDQFAARFSFVSSTRTFSLRHDSSYNSGYTVTCKPEGEEIDVTVLFRPSEDKMVESLSAGEVFESGVSFVEFDSLYQRAVFTESGDEDVSEAISDDVVTETSTEAEAVPAPELHGSAIEAEAKLEPEPEKRTEEVVKVSTKRQSTVTGQRCTLEIDGRVKVVSQESISLIIEEIKGAENYWVFKPGSQHSWRNEFIKYSRQRLSINEGEQSQRDHSYSHWKSKAWKEKSFISPEEAREKLKSLLEANEFGAESPFKAPQGLGREVQLDWAPPVEMASASIDELYQFLSEANECWVLTRGSEKSGYKEFIQYLFDDGDGPGTYEKWRGGAPVQREKISPEDALKKAKNYLDSEEFVTASYLSHFSGDLKQKQPVKAVTRRRGSGQSTAGIEINGGSCGCMAIFIFFALVCFFAEFWAGAIFMMLMGLLVGRFMTSKRKH
ncbi:MAG: hypothetical protein QF426_06985 [Verrucomicrobiales bacterium]|nr:hypothetical protein [Verrucomicrobiales bacterium]